MRLGFNWPLGPLELAELIGPARAVGILDALRELHGEAYRASPLLRWAAADGVPLRDLGRARLDLRPSTRFRIQSCAWGD